MTDLEKETGSAVLPIICGTYPAIVSVYLHVIAGGRDFFLLAPAVTEALQTAGLSVHVGDGYLTIAGRHEAHLPAYRMDQNVWDECIGRGYTLGKIIPISVRNIYSGGQHGAGKARIYIYEKPSGIDEPPAPIFVARGDESYRFLDMVRDFAREHTCGPPDIDDIVRRLTKPLYASQTWAPLMADTRGVVGRALFTGPGQPDISYFADSMVAMIEGDEGFEYIPIPNGDGKPRYVVTWTHLIQR